MPWQYGTAVFLPAFWFQYVDDVLSLHQVDITAIHIDCQIFVLKFRIKADDIHSTFSHVAKEQFHEIALPCPLLPSISMLAFVLSSVLL